jgi:hypothetical protein
MARVTRERGCFARMDIEAHHNGGSFAFPKRPGSTKRAFGARPKLISPKVASWIGQRSV